MDKNMETTIYDNFKIICCAMIHTPKLTRGTSLRNVWSVIKSLDSFLYHLLLCQTVVRVHTVCSTVCIECSCEHFYSVLQDHQLVCAAWFRLRSHYPKAIYSIDHYQMAFLLWLQKNIFTSPEHAYKMLHWTKEEQEWFRLMPLTYSHLWTFSGS